MNGSYINETKVQYPCEDYIGNATWFNANVTVNENNDTASVYINGELKTTALQMSFPYKPSGGVMVLNGFENVINFRHLQILPDQSRQTICTMFSSLLKISFSKEQS